jgi:hypothetical protein
MLIEAALAEPNTAAISLYFEQKSKICRNYPREADRLAPLSSRRVFGLMQSQASVCADRDREVRGLTRLGSFPSMNSNWAKQGASRMLCGQPMVP